MEVTTARFVSRTCAGVDQQTIAIKTGREEAEWHVSIVDAAAQGTYETNRGNGVVIGLAGAVKSLKFVQFGQSNPVSYTLDW